MWITNQDQQQSIEEIQQRFPEPINTLNTPWFTGWKGRYPSGHQWKDGEIPDGERPVWVAQWILSYVDPSNPPYLRRLYVNMPGMEYGDIRAGESFDVGTASVTEDTPGEEVIKSVEEGFSKMLELMKDKSFA